MQTKITDDSISLKHPLTGNRRVVALERDKKRCGILKERLQKLGMAQCVEVKKMDFKGFQPDSARGKEIDAILLDPTCSGSGLVSDRHGVHSDKDSPEKLEKLSNAQKRLLEHAMSFENVKRIVYSTCSVHEEENEKVVEWALEQSDGQFEVKMALDNWGQRGKEEYEFGERVVRVSNENKENLQGFFVAALDRKDADFDTPAVPKDINLKTSAKSKKGKRKREEIMNVEGISKGKDKISSEPLQKKNKVDSKKKKQRKKENRAKKRRVNAPKSKFGFGR